MRGGGRRSFFECLLVHGGIKLYTMPLHFIGIGWPAPLLGSFWAQPAPESLSGVVSKPDSRK